MACEERFIEQLRERGFRFTPQRELILSALHQIDGFASAEEIYARVHQQCSSIDLSTVYRTLDLLQEFGLVATLDADAGRQSYELLGVHGLHHHLRCTNCGAVIPVADHEVRPLIEHLERTYGFATAPASLTFSGLCPACLSSAHPLDPKQSQNPG